MLAYYLLLTYYYTYCSLQVIKLESRKLEPPEQMLGHLHGVRYLVITPSRQSKCSVTCMGYVT